jgi:ketosteroid isomerase-like protein
MPKEFLELIRRGHEGFNRGDLSWVRDSVAEDVEWHPTGSFPGFEGVYLGHDAVDLWMETIRAEWSEFEVSMEEVLGEADDAVVIIERLWGRGRESGVETEMRIYVVYRFNEEGKVARRQAFTAREEALAALGSSDA